MCVRWYYTYIVGTRKYNKNEHVSRFYFQTREHPNVYHNTSRYKDIINRGTTSDHRGDKIISRYEEMTKTTRLTRVLCNIPNALYIIIYTCIQWRVSIKIYIYIYIYGVIEKLRRSYIFYIRSPCIQRLEEAAAAVLYSHMEAEARYTRSYDFCFDENINFIDDDRYNTTVYKYYYILTWGASIVIISPQSSEEFRSEGSSCEKTRSASASDRLFLADGHYMAEISTVNNDDDNTNNNNKKIQTRRAAQRYDDATPSFAG